MSRRLLRLLLRSGAAQRQVLSAAADQHQQRIQSSCLVAASTRCQLLQEHLWVQQQPWQLQQAQGIHQQQQQQAASRFRHADVSRHRAFAAAADPARAIAENMAEVAQRKLADVQRQHAGLTSKMEGWLTVAHVQQQLPLPWADTCSLLCTVHGGLATLSTT